MYFSIFLIALSLAIATFLFLRKVLKPVTPKKVQFVEESKKAGRTLNQYNWREWRDRLLRKIKYVNMSDEFREELNKDLSRLGWEYTAEDIRRMQILYVGIYSIFTFLMLWISLFMGIIMLAFTPLIWNIPISYIKKEIKARNEEFLNRLDELYTVIYNQYKRKNDEHLGNIINAYLPTTTDLMKKELIIILRDIESGEEYALKQLKSRIPNPTVMRFCDIIMSNLEGVDNRDVMENFYMELKAVRDRRRRKRNEMKEQRLNFVVNMLYVPFFFLVIVFLIVSNYYTYKNP